MSTSTKKPAAAAPPKAKKTPSAPKAPAKAAAQKAPAKAAAKVPAVKTSAGAPAVKVAAKTPALRMTSREAMLARVEAVRLEQRSQGNFDCFGRAGEGYCDQGACAYHAECLSVSRLLHSL